METKVFFPNSKGDKLCGILSNPSGHKSKPVIILVHGFTSSKETGKMVTLKKNFDEHNISSLRIDLYGHGESEGKFEDITATEGADDVMSAITYLKQEGYTRIGLIGSSFGGLSSLLAASKTDDLFVLGLSVPVSDNLATQNHIKSEEERAQWRERGYISEERSNGEKLKLNYSYYEDSKTTDVYSVAHKIKVPTIIVHGNKDTTVLVAQSQKVSTLIPNCQLVIVEGADHVYSNPEHLKFMIKTLSDFVIKHASS